MHFHQAIEQQLAQFTPYLAHTVFTAPNAFSVSREKVAFFVQEIQATAQILARAENQALAEFYADQLLRQFKSLQNAVEKIQHRPAEKTATRFQSNYRFPRNIHNLPAEKRLAEYKKALRALNEKISWLIEQNYAASEEEKAMWQGQIQETEYRKMKCLAAIQELE